MQAGVLNRHIFQSPQHSVCLNTLGESLGSTSNLGLCKHPFGAMNARDRDRIQMWCMVLGLNTSFVAVQTELQFSFWISCFLLLIISMFSIRLLSEK